MQKSFPSCLSWPQKKKNLNTEAFKHQLLSLMMVKIQNTKWENCALVLHFSLKKEDMIQIQSYAFKIPNCISIVTRTFVRSPNHSHSLFSRQLPTAQPLPADKLHTLKAQESLLIMFNNWGRRKYIFTQLHGLHNKRCIKLGVP